METANLPSVVSLGLKQAAQLDQCKNFVPTSYTVDVGQSLFTKPLKPENLDQIQTHSVKLEDTEFDYDIEYSTDHVPLGEILDRLQNEDRYETNDKSNLIRLHAANDSNAATISATLNFATLDLSSQSSLQSHLSEINDVLFSINKPDPSLPLAISTNSPPSVPDNVNSIFCASPSPASSSDQEIPLGKNTSGLLNVLSAQSPPGPSQQPVSFGTSSESNKTSPQECNLCNKMFGNASALAKHRLTHSDERKYLCTVCHKAFKRQDHLNGHLLTHRNKKPFECTAQGCNKSYCDARSLRRHRENHHSSKEDKLVSPASSITSSDLDEKSLGSESCDGSIKGTKLVFTGINCLEKEKLTKITTDTQQFQLIEQILRESKECQEAPPAIQVKTPTTPGPSPRPRPRTQFQSQQVMSHQQRTNVTTKSTDSDLNQNMVECSICSRKFKNIPALNGHMRLHGGYYRKDNDKNKQQQHHQQHQADNSHKVIVSSEPVSTHRVSSNVISLIEEKIIQKRKLEPSSSSGGRLATVTGYISSPTPQHQHPSSLMSPTQKFTFLTSSSPSSSSASCSITSVLCSTSTSVTPTTTIVEPPHKRLALESNHKTISSLDNLVFPVLPQPDTDKLLANLQAKQPSPPLSHHMTTLNTFLPDSPHLPNVPLPDKRCGSSIVTTASLANNRLQLQLSSPVNTSIIKDTSSTITPVKSAHQQKLLKIQRTDFQPSIGDDFQAVLPEVISSRAEDVKYGLTPLDTLMWSPDLDSELSEPQLEAYLKLASSSAVKDNGNNVENALYTLLLCNGSISRASQRLLGFMKLEDDLYSSSALSSPSMMSSSVKSSSRDWTAEEVDMFYEALCKHKKDFAKISGDFPNKSIKDCVEFYYLWKNICREESQSFKSIISDNSEEIDSDILAI